ncbi:hypothetical protein NUH30_19350 [Leptospira sp. 85282-16]|uniref:hypothetical protein n=1 Tax=Leptospira sp. 85282-16 TaxID=2971256 RepID=UPI0021C1ABC3|nr:hypothetical protein [Leptospira sp. 85282-16]MCT8335852.1 hypothetical protein [Leptospira sp. 85282-16]
MNSINSKILILLILLLFSNKCDTGPKGTGVSKRDQCKDSQPFREGRTEQRDLICSMFFSLNNTKEDGYDSSLIACLYSQKLLQECDKESKYFIGEDFSL